MLYELKYGNSVLTFYAQTDAIAAFCSIFTGLREYELRSCNTGFHHTFLIYGKQPWFEKFETQLSDILDIDLSDIDQFMTWHREEIISCFGSFAFIAPRLRHLYDHYYNSTSYEAGNFRVTSTLEHLIEPTVQEDHILTRIGRARHLFCNYSWDGVIDRLCELSQDSSFGIMT